MSTKQLPGLGAKDKHFDVVVEVCELLTLSTSSKANNREFSDDAIPQFFEILNLILVHDPLLLNGPEYCSTPSVYKILSTSLSSAL